MLRIGATQRYHDLIIAGINDVQELPKTHEAIAQGEDGDSTPHPDAIVSRFIFPRLSGFGETAAAIGFSPSLRPSQLRRASRLSKGDLFVDFH